MTLREKIQETLPGKDCGSPFRLSRFDLDVIKRLLLHLADSDPNFRAELSYILSWQIFDNLNNNYQRHGILEEVCSSLLDKQVTEV